MDLISQQFIHNLNINLRDKIPLLILVSFVLLLVLVFLNRKELKTFFKKIKRKTWLILFLIFFLALGLRLFVAPHLIRTFYDEAWYMQTAERLVETNFLSQGNYAKAIGWPFILALFFKVFGVSTWTALYASSILGALTIFNIFFLTFLLFKKESIALWSSFLFSLIPLHIVWSGSAEANVPSLFFITFGLFLSLLYFRRKTIYLLFLSLMSLGFAAQFRQENYLYFFIFFAGLIIFGKISFKKIIHFKLNYHKLITVLTWIFLVLLLLLLTGPNLIQVLNFQMFANWAQLESVGKISAQNWSFSNLVYNFPTWGIHIFTNKYHPLIFTALFIAGVIFILKRKRKEILFLGIWFFLFFFVYFSSWSTLSLKSRFLTSFYPITTILAGVSVYLIYKKISQKVNPKKIAIIFILGFLLVFYPSIKKEIGANFFKIHGKLETKIPEMAEKEIPSNCLIISNKPEMISATTDLRAIELGPFLDSKFEETLYYLETPLDIESETKEDGIVSLVKPYNTDCLLFFEDYSCEIIPIFPQWIKNCRDIKERYKLVPYLTYSEKETFVKLVVNINWDSSPPSINILGIDKTNNPYLLSSYYQFNKTTKEIGEETKNLKEKCDKGALNIEGLSARIINPGSKKVLIEATKSYTFYRLYSKNTEESIRTK